MSPTLILALLIIFGIILILVEVLFTPGIGVAGILGLGSLVWACVYTFNNFGSTAGIWMTAIISLSLLFLVIYALRAKTWKKLELNTEIGDKLNTDAEKVKVGDKGVTITRRAPRGTAKFENLSSEVKSADNSMVDPATEIEIVAIENNEIIVKPIKD